MKKVIIPIVLAAILLVPNLNLVYAAPFSNNVATDFYATAVNGIPTAAQGGFPSINDAIDFLLTGAVGATANNEAYDNRFTEPDEIWQELGNGEIAIIGLSAGNANTVGVYTDIGTGAVRTPVLGPFSGGGFSGDGTMANPYPAAMTGLALNQIFGWYLDSTSGAGTDTWFSEAALKPSLDHMMTYDLSDLSGKKIHIQFDPLIPIPPPPVEITLGSNTFLITWEDLPLGGGTLGDDDYNDMMYLITNVDDFRIVGGDIIPIETTSLILAGAQSFSWMIPVIVSSLGIAIFIARKL